MLTAMYSGNYKIARSGCATVYKCFDGAEGLKAIKLWLCTPCCGTAPMVDHKADCIEKAQRLTTHIPTLVKGVQLHASHSLFVFRGLVYCSHCGFYAAHAVKKLKAPCGEGLDVCPTQQGLANLTRIGQGKLPVSLSVWPAHTPPYLSNPVPMPISTACASSAPLLSLSTT